MSLIGNYVYIQQENVEDILLQNINNWSHSVSASSLIFPGLSRSCNELKSDENCLLLFCSFMFSWSSQSARTDSWNTIKITAINTQAEFDCTARPGLHVVPVMFLHLQLGPNSNDSQSSGPHLAPVGATESNVKTVNR